MICGRAKRPGVMMPIMQEYRFELMDVLRIVIDDGQVSIVMIGVKGLVKGHNDQGLVVDGHGFFMKPRVAADLLEVEGELIGAQYHFCFFDVVNLIGVGFK